MFTKQHYKAIAEIIKDNQPEISPHAPESELQEGAIKDYQRYVGLALADYFAGNNPLFDRQKFLEACGIS